MLAGDVGERLGNLEAASQHIDPPPAQRHRLAPPEAAVGEDVDERHESGRHRTGEAVNLGGLQEQLLTVLELGKLHPDRRIRP
ncbi:MAG: hypothetical protein HKO63_09895 [Acidimicrobiia bacterium]|nr:hypothetical protein [Acidimicrobiia bacterium]NNL98503.1 hypothetical protein [Acidimicrobiia bacterium]